MRGCPRAIRYHSVILAPFPTPESARFGLCIDRHTKNRPLRDELVFSPKSYMWATFGNMRGFPMQANFFAVIMNPNTRVGAAGVTKPPFRVPMHSCRPPKHRIPTPERRGHRKMQPESAHFCSARGIAGILHIFSAAVFGPKTPTAPAPTEKPRFPRADPLGLRPFCTRACRRNRSARVWNRSVAREAGIFTAAIFLRFWPYFGTAEPVSCRIMGVFGRHGRWRGFDGGAGQHTAREQRHGFARYNAIHR